MLIRKKYYRCFWMLTWKFALSNLRNRFSTFFTHIIYRFRVNHCGKSCDFIILSSLWKWAIFWAIELLVKLGWSFKLNNHNKFKLITYIFNELVKIIDPLRSLAKSLKQTLIQTIDFVVIINRLCYQNYLVAFELRALNEGFSTFRTDVNPGPMCMQMFSHCWIVAKHFCTALVGAGNGARDLVARLPFRPKKEIKIDINL